MAAKDGQKGTDLAPTKLSEVLEQKPYRFQFFQAVRLLERFLDERTPVGGYGNPSAEVVRLAVHASTQFPASEIQSLQKQETGPPRMTVNFFGLTGPVGVLPTAYTEMLAERLRSKDTTLRDFLDIFHHRILSLFYMAWRKNRAPVMFERAEKDQFSGRLMSLVGLGTRGMRNRQEIPDSAFLFYAGLLMMQTRPAAALESILRDYFGAGVEVGQFVGGWYPVSPGAQCKLGEEGYSSRLGRGAVVGDEIWDRQSRIRVKIGPLTRSHYDDFLPGGDSHRRLKAWITLFAGLECDVEVQLVLRREQVPACELSGAGGKGPRLGWTTWVNNKPFDRHPDDAVFEILRPA
ncbi:type VI secretion system baseplate subunit TssG [Paludibaculum fermentans]|uniref:Type VI secretion system baseplate subunit TssG n=1 Tax=Paludibaculum fermentans TaxID=1473598 RepID=A0A7S7NSH7_PALFE|nr:type VI secretion system baseplate subunit TssG [Paludibaculum fermentans]QOY88439.1 type VI secretion system baseplate subunit TssG [Paludibaculum fermentans]